MYKVGKNWKYTEWPQTELEDLTVQSTLYRIYALGSYPPGSKFDLFRSTAMLNFSFMVSTTMLNVPKKIR